ncbi:hypothetical protein NLJ89_g1775 [Agrocybe chaxingu]|uniref:Rho GTPase activation protein n=1 Tax=Agrocybe chaxingu TaxID=84603 RepID=A0A9W8TEM8_9AGAR|nr:hypothetical protein NLJ89_g1775 [Agrocybe chaxingu]
MSSPWDRYATASPDDSREFLVSVELYISNAAGATLRKPLAKNKKSDKRDSAGEDARLKEKASSTWLSLQRGLNGAGHWRSATCKLLEEGERCLLNVYVDESILYQTVYIHLLNQSDIRQAETSLFYRKDCLGIFCIAGQRWTPSNTAEPLYIQFANADTCATWQALLKSYAIPEIYGRWFFPLDGGSYRPSNNGDPNDGDGGDVDVSCEIHLNDILCSRTTVKRGLGSPDWHESFSFPGLPPFENLDVVVWKEKKLHKPSILGMTRIALGNFRRGDTVEGFFPVMQAGSIGTEVQVGDLRLKIRVDEEIILPYSSYAGLLKTCHARNFLDWMSDLENRLKLKNISTHLMAIAVAKNNVIEQVQKYASREVDNSSTSHQTLFRGNTTLTKVIELCMTWYGKAFLEASIGNVLRRLCAEKVAIEVDPVRSGKSTKDVERNVEQLIYWCQEFWNQIYSVRTECPNEMRILFQTIRRLVEQRYNRPDPTAIDTNTNFRWQSVSAFCFLRFIVPVSSIPIYLGFVQVCLPPLPVQRSLTLIAKVIQSLANLNATAQKEAFMRGVQEFLKNSVPAMIDYIAIVSTPVEENPPPHTSGNMNRHDRLNVVNALRQRTSKMTVLDRESVPILPHLLDIPKHLAIITSAVIRSSRDLSARPRTGDDVDLAVDEFCSKCFEVEEEALRRVSQLATKLASESRRPSVPDISATGTDHHHDNVPHSPLSTITSTVISAAAPPRRRKPSRPSTAPSPTGSSSPSRRQMFFNDSLTSPQTFTRTIPNDQRAWGGHMKAPSTDSVPSPINRDIPIPVRIPRTTEPPDTDDAGKRKKGLLRGILRR